MTSPSASHRKPLLLLVAPFAHPHKDLVATTLSWMCREKDVLFDAYYAAHRNDGGIFSPHGSTVIGGRHAAMLGHAIAEYETTVIRLGDFHIMATLIQSSAAHVIDAPSSLIDLYTQCATLLDLKIPEAVVAYQQDNLPPGMLHGMAELVPTREGHRLADRDDVTRRPAVVQYAFAEAVYRKAWALPYELDAVQRTRLPGLGIRNVWTVACKDCKPWDAAELTCRSAEIIGTTDDFGTLSLRVARRWLDSATAVDIHEPLLASYWLPHSVRENRLQVAAPNMAEVCAAVAPLMKAKGQTYYYGRYGGGSTRGAQTDEDIFPLFKQAISFEVVEPGRPALTVLSHDPHLLPQPPSSPFDLEPSDEELRQWATDGKIPIALVYHSGEMSHDDGNMNIMDLSAATRVCGGLGMHYQRYWFDPDCVEPLHTPQDEGGVLGLCEPVLHSTGLGILAESMVEPQRAAQLMRDARERIVRVAGERFAPRGVYCYLDAHVWNWDEPNTDLWMAIRDAGFEYVLSSVAPGTSRVLYRDGSFVVLSQTGGVHYPFSPFMRIDTVVDIVAEERRLINRRRPGWIMAVLDTPIYAYSTYLSIGDPFKNRGGLGQFYKYISSHGETGRLVSATPHTIARYACLTGQV